MKFIKKHINTIIGILVFIIVFVGILIVKDALNPQEGNAIYGNRLEGREEVEITKTTKDKVINSLNEQAKSTKVRVSGRIVNIIINVNDDTNLEVAKSLGPKALESFSAKEKKYYDFQFLIENTANKNQFPIIGYKHHGKEDISWTKDRAES